jgi:hypothetical protein
MTPVIPNADHELGVTQLFPNVHAQLNDER